MTAFFATDSGNDIGPYEQAELACRYGDNILVEYLITSPAPTCSSTGENVFACFDENDTDSVNKFIRGIDCENPNIRYTSSINLCDQLFVEYENNFEDPDKNTGDPGDCRVGNPCNPSTGNKFQRETDYQGPNKFSFGFERYYNSKNLVDFGLGFGWSHNFHKFLHIRSSGRLLTQISPQGRGETWEYLSGKWVGSNDSRIRLKQETDRFVITKSNGDIEYYDLLGRIISEVDINGATLEYSYIDNEPGVGRLGAVRNNIGHTILFEYQNGNLVRVFGTDENLVLPPLPGLRPQTNNAPPEMLFEYDNKNNLVSIEFFESNEIKIYHYENMNYPHHLTGITDENGDRISTYTYTSSGLIRTTESAKTSNGEAQNKFTLVYGQGGN